MPDPIRIATRSSPLALWQAEHVRTRLLASEPDAPVELVPMTTDGDRWLGTSLARLGGKGLFVKALESALLEHDADLAVHSMKDMTAMLPEGLVIATVLERENPFDAFVSTRHASFDALPTGAIVGTCSVRRRAQLLAARPDLEIRDLRGNVNTRLAKLDAGEFDAIVLAAAGLLRLGFASRIRHELSRELSLPAVSQGTIGIECRDNDRDLKTRLEALHDHDSADRMAAERAFSAALNGGCSAPIAAFATLDGNRLSLEGRVFAHDGSERLIERIDGDRRAGVDLGERLAATLLERGAQGLLDTAAAVLA